MLIKRDSFASSGTCKDSAYSRCATTLGDGEAEQSRIEKKESTPTTGDTSAIFAIVVVFGFYLRNERQITPEGKFMSPSTKRIRYTLGCGGTGT